MLDLEKGINSNGDEIIDDQLNFEEIKFEYFGEAFGLNEKPVKKQVIISKERIFKKIVPEDNKGTERLISAKELSKEI